MLCSASYLTCHFPVPHLLEHVTTRARCWVRLPPFTRAEGVRDAQRRRHRRLGCRFQFEDPPWDPFSLHLGVGEVLPHGTPEKALELRNVPAFTSRAGEKQRSQARRAQTVGGPARTVSLAHFHLVGDWLRSHAAAAPVPTAPGAPKPGSASPFPDDPSEGWWLLPKPLNVTGNV